MRMILVCALLATLLGCSEVARSEVPSVSIAQRYVGMHEVRDRAALKNFIAVDPKLIPWCAAFVNAVLEELGIEGTNSLMARSFLAIGRSVQKPRVGDIVILRRGSNPASGHVGFYMGERDGYVQVLGGNQGRAVSIAQYPKRQLLGYRRIEDPSAGQIVLVQGQTRNSMTCDIKSEEWTWTQGCYQKGS